MAPKERAPRPVKTRARGPRGSSKPWYKVANATSMYALGGLVAFLAMVFLLMKSPTKPAATAPKAASKPVRVQRSWKRTAQGPKRGVVATQDISKGTLIMLDTPFVGVADMENKTLASEILLGRIHNLPESAKADYFNLPYTASALVDQSPDALAANIFESNSIRAGNTHTVFKNSAFIDHSCDPNADFFFRDDLEALVVHAVRDIKKGEQIFCPHFDAAVLTSAERETYMLEAKGHKCTCPVCSLTGDAKERSDARRGQLGAIKELMREWSDGTSSDPGDALQAVEIAYQLLAEEHYDADLGWWAGNAVQICAAHEDKECVMKWAKVAGEHYAVYAGEDSPAVKGINIIMADPERSQAWGRRTVIETQDSLETDGETTEVEETLMEESDATDIGSETSESEIETETKKDEEDSD